MENIEENIVEIVELNEDNVEPIVDKNKDFTNQLQKPKKPRTQKQIDALKKAQETRKINIEARKLAKQNDNKYIEETKSNVTIDTQELIKQQKKVVFQENDDDSSSSEEEIIYIPKSKKKKKKKKVIVHQSSSSSDDDEEVEQQNIPSYFSKPKLRYSDVFRFQ